MSRYAIRSSLAALGFIVAAAGLSGTAIAAPDTDTDTDTVRQVQGKHHDGKHGRHHARMKMHDGFWVPGVGPLSKQQIESLKLDAKQQAAFDEAKQAQGALHKSMREAGAKRHELLNSQLTNGKLDPHALTARQDEGRDQFRQQSEQVRGKWLAAWDSLNDGQRQQVTELVKARQAKMQERHAKRQDRRAGKAAPEAKQAVPAN
ncbi:hypothetical protein [Bordetella sp. BOR01]|uniref:hypothetical protein n=1 Tax=Bordetella sp. BOR01 TaxID=2854779 RepID=UPI001C470D41|nr:hypothetical protein [Bordetella sp. BOR01]MBV7485925.1 hypothetical protein [Bordetella sp. BOR01]